VFDGIIFVPPIVLVLAGGIERGDVQRTAPPAFTPIRNKRKFAVGGGRILRRGNFENKTPESKTQSTQIRFQTGLRRFRADAINLRPSNLTSVLICVKEK
jgi:hypothetical protein